MSPFAERSISLSFFRVSTIVGNSSFKLIPAAFAIAFTLFPGIWLSFSDSARDDKKSPHFPEK